MIRCDSPRCCECARPLDVCEPFTDHVAHHLACPGCKVRLHVRRMADGWHIRTAAESAGQPDRVLPPVASAVLRRRLFDACRSVAQLLRPSDPVEPGMAAMIEPPRREVIEPLGIAHGAVSGCEASQHSYPQPRAAVTGKRGTAVPV